MQHNSNYVTFPLSQQGKSTRKRHINRKWEKMLEGYKEYLRLHAKAENSIETYLKHVELYFRWFRETTGSEGTKLFRANVLDYISYMKTIKNYEPVTINSKLSALNSYNQYLIDTNKQQDAVILQQDFISVQVSIASPNDLEDGDIEAIRQAALEDKRYGLRNFAIITLLAFAGLRVSELTNVKPGDVVLELNEVTVMGKGNKVRTAYFNDKVKFALREYLKERGETDCPYLFLSQKKGRLSREQVARILKKYSKKTSRDITPHTLRHYFCSHALETGYTITEVANQAGHSSIETTARYEHPKRKEMREKAKRM